MRQLLGSLFVASIAAIGIAGTVPQSSTGKTKTVHGHTMETVTPKYFNTLSLPIQINNHFLIKGELMEHDNPMPPLKGMNGTGSASNIVLGSASLDPTAKVAPTFPGIGPTGWTPPDPNLACGPNYLVETVNTAVAFFRKSDGAMVFNQDFGTFFAPVTGHNTSNFLFDPKTMYDPVSQRFFVLADEGAGTESNLDIAVSQTSDPNGGWYEYQFNASQTISGNQYWLDYPSLACSNTYVAMTGNMFPVSNGGFGGVQFIIANKAQMLAGQPVTPTSLQDPGLGSAQMARNSEPNQATVFGMALSSNSTMRVYAFSPSVSIPVQIIMQLIDIPIPQFSGANTATSLGQNQIETLGDRIFNVYQRNGHLVTGHSVQGTTGFAASRWEQVGLNGWPTSGLAPSLIQSGDLSTGAADDSYFPGINENNNGDISVIYSTSNANSDPAIVLSTRNSTDPLGQMSKPITLGTSANASAYTEYRWGDFFDISIDPIDNQTFWGVDEAVDVNGNWQTYFYTWTTNSGTGQVNYPPTSYQVLQGNQMSGTLQSLAVVDGNTFNMGAGLQKGYGSVTSLETNYTGIAAPKNFVNVIYDINPLATATVFVYAWNYTTSQFDLVSSKPANVNTPVTVKLQNFNNYVKNGNAQVILREAIPTRKGLGLVFFNRIDQLIIAAS